MEIYKGIKNLFSRYRTRVKKTREYFEEGWKEFLGSIYDSYFATKDLFDWRTLGESYRQNIVRDMGPVLVRNNFGAYFIKTGFVFERRGLEEMIDKNYL